MPNINAANISSILLTEQATKPSQPATGKWALYTKSGGLFLEEDDASERQYIYDGQTFTNLVASAGTLNNVAIGGGTPAAGAFTTLSASGAVTFTSGTVNGVVIGGVTPAAGSFTTLSATGNVTLNGGTLVYNEAGADLDARFEGDTDANLLFLDASTDRIGIGTATPAAKLDVLSTTAQARLSYDGSNYASCTVGSAGTLTIAPSGAILAVTGSVVPSAFMRLTRSDKTISGGVITVTTSYTRVDTEASAATDDLDTINGGTDGDIIVLQTVVNTRDVVVKHGTGNIQLNGAADFTLSNFNDKLMLIYYSNVGNWNEIGRGDNA